MKVSISEAARIAGISRQHLYTKYINPGLISVEKDSQGKPHIDTAELIRVFDTIAIPDSNMSANGQDLIGELSRTSSCPSTIGSFPGKREDFPGAGSLAPEPSGQAHGYHPADRAQTARTVTGTRPA
jgi:hypothetical protein